ncbi:MAG: hypothetical protein IJW02_01295 [Clostridia bacterium]|nr:hypothetical protein [Clostridia bacterium]
MKAKRILAFTIALVVVISVILGTAVPASALEITNEITKVYVDVPGAEAGRKVNNSPEIVTWVDNKNHYEITYVQWYKDNYDDDHKMNSGTVFLGGNTYYMQLIVKAKGDRTWPADDEDLRNFDAKINPGTAKEKTPMRILRGLPLDENAKEYIRIVYKFDEIPDGVIYYPPAKLDAPMAGSKQDFSVESDNPLVEPESSVSWSKMTEKGWVYLPPNEVFIPGNTYRAEFGLSAVDGMRFDVSAEPSSEPLYVKGFFNGKPIDYLVNREDYNIEQGRLTATVIFDSVKTEQIESVEFSGISAPVAGNHPTFSTDSITTGDYTYAIDSEYVDEGYVNGVSWFYNSQPMTENDVFEEGETYTLSFTVRSDIAHTFFDFLEASVNEGIADVMVDFLDPTVCYVAVRLVCGTSGELTNVTMGVGNVVHGQSHTANLPTFGTGYNVSGEIEWFDVTDPDNAVKLSPDKTFVYGNTYRIKVPIAVYDYRDFTFGDSLTAEVSGAKSVKAEKVSDTEAIIIADFDVAPSRFPFDLDFSIAVPTEGGSFSEKILLDEIFKDIVRIVKASWYCEGSNDPMSLDDRFEADFLYYLQLTVNLSSEYYFVDGVNASVNGNYADFSVISPDLAFINYVFYPEKLPEVIISFDIGEGVGDVEEIKGKPGTQVTLPGFDGCSAPTGCEFIGWASTSGSNTVLDSDGYLVPNTYLPLTLYAVYAPANNDDISTHIHVYSDTRVDFGDGTCGYRCILEFCPDPDFGKNDMNAPEPTMMHQYGNNTPCDEVCNNCGHVRTEDHDGGDLHFYFSDCQENCSVCGKHRETTVDHTPGAAATCTEAQRCTACSKILAFSTGHEFSDPTCTSAGSCIHEGCEETVGIPLGHTPGTEATCTDPQICTVCQALLVPALGHTPGASATCTEPQLCTVCTAELNPANGHTPAGAATCTEPSKCSECGAILAEATGHTYGESYLNDENEHYKLCACGDRSEGEAHADDDGDKSCDKCGYDMSTGLGAGAIVAIVLGSVAVVGGGGFCLFWFVIRKKRI